MAARVYRFGEFRLDLATRTLWCAGSEVALPPKALDCIGYLVGQHGRAVGRDELIAAVWGRADISDNALGQAILQARRALRTGSSSAIDAIRTVPRFGYHWQMPVVIEESRVPDDRSLGIIVKTMTSPVHPSGMRADDVSAAAATARIHSNGPARSVIARTRHGGAAMRLVLLTGVALLMSVVQGSQIETRHLGDSQAIGRSDQPGSAAPTSMSISESRAAAARFAGNSSHPAAAHIASSDPVATRLQAIDASILSGRLDQARSDLSRLDALDRQRPEVRYQIARVDFMQGRLDSAQTAFESLLDQLPADGHAVLRARILNALGNLAYLREDPAAVLAHSDAAIQALKGHEAPSERGRAWVGRASGHTSLQQYDNAMADYARARIAFSEAGDPLALARVDAYQGLLEVTRGRPADALPMLTQAADRLQGFDAVIEELHARVGLVYAFLALLRPDDAFAQNARLADLGIRVGDSRRRHYADFARLRALTSTGRLDEADALLETLRTTAAFSPGAFMDRNRRDLPVLATQLAFARDDVASAVPEAIQAIALAGEDASDRALARLINWQMRVRLGQLDHAGRIARAADPQDADMAPGTRIRLAVLEAGQAGIEGDSARARAAFDRALTLAEDYRVPAELLQVAQPYVRYLLAQGDHARASVVAGRVAGWASVDYAAALLQVELYGALDQTRAWVAAMAQARSLAGERRIPPELVMMPTNRIASSPDG